MGILSLEAKGAGFKPAFAARFLDRPKAGRDYPAERLAVKR
jgi:hypothetical protein